MVFAASWSELIGASTAVTIPTGIVGWWLHINCIEKGCWRKGHPDPEHGHPLCRRHSKLADGATVVPSSR